MFIVTRGTVKCLQIVALRDNLITSVTKRFTAVTPGLPVLRCLIIILIYTSLMPSPYISRRNLLLNLF